MDHAKPHLSSTPFAFSPRFNPSIACGFHSHAYTCTQHNSGMCKVKEGSDCRRARRFVFEQHPALYNTFSNRTKHFNPATGIHGDSDKSSYTLI